MQHFDVHLKSGVVFKSLGTDSAFEFPSIGMHTFHVESQNTAVLVCFVANRAAKSLLCFLMNSFHVALQVA